jgi:nucleoid-associated protein YgaU
MQNRASGRGDAQQQFGGQPFIKPGSMVDDISGFALAAGMSKLGLGPMIESAGDTPLRGAYRDALTMANPSRAAAASSGNSMQERASGKVNPAPVATSSSALSQPQAPVAVEVNTPEEYAIREGATLSGIAGGDMEKVKELAAYNNIKDPDLIYAGAKLKIPATMQLNNLNQFLSAM